MTKFGPILVSAALLCAIMTDGAAQTHSVVIPVQFSDVGFTQKQIKEKVSDLFNGENYRLNDATGSVSEYFKDNLGEDLKFIFHVADPVTVSKPKAYYGANTEKMPDENITALVYEACTEAVKNGTDFSGFDSDEDGLIDHIYLFFAGYNEAESDNKDDILPQSWDVSGKQYLLGDKKIGKFSCCSEYIGDEGEIFATIGTICHELGHFIGFKDMYDVNGPIEGLSQGLYGTVSLMDRGNYNNKGRTPPYFNALELDALGLLRKTPAVKGLVYELSPLHKSHEALVIETENPGEYFLIEYREMEKWDAYIGGRGALVYHIDKSASPAGSMTAALRWDFNSVNACAAHPCAVLVDAFDMGEASECFYPGRFSVVTISSNENMPLLLWDGSGLGIGLSISFNSKGNIIVSLVDDNGWNIPYAENCSAVVNQTDTEIHWTSSNEVKAEWSVSWLETGSGRRYTAVTDTTFCKLSPLIPGEKYECTIFAREGAAEGRSVKIVFSTIPQLSQFPLIAEMDKKYVAGDSLRLHLLNCSKNNTAQWNINGNPYEKEYYKFLSPGIYVIKVEIEDEILEKTITVDAK